MAESNLTLTVRFIDMASAKLLLLSLRMLESEMRIGASPYAERLSSILDRFTAVPDDIEDQGDMGNTLP